MTELTKIAEEIKTTWEQMKTKNDELLEAVKKGNAFTAEDKAFLEKMGFRLDDLEIKLQRQAVVHPGNDELAPLSEKAVAYKKTFYKWMRGGMEGLDVTERKLMAEYKVESKALVENTAGLYMMPEDLEAEIYRSLPKLNHMRNLAGIRTTSRDKVRRRSLTEVSMGWGKLETGKDITESTLTPSEDYIYVEDLYGLTKIGEDELDDTDANLEGLVVDSFTRKRSETEDTAFTVGTGHTYSQPEGVAVESDLTEINLDTADDIDPDDMIDVEYELPEQYLSGAVFLMHRKTEKALRLQRAEVSSGYYGQYLWQPSLLAGQPNTFDGYPIHNQGDMNYPADTTAGNVVVFGNFNAGYRIIDRKGLAIQRLNELYAESGLIGFKAHFRVGGGVVRTDAFRTLYNNT